MAPSAFSVGLFSPVGHYQQAERSVTYGVLFIVLTFVTFFLYELLSPVTLHPVQYFLVTCSSRTGPCPWARSASSEDLHV